MAVSLVRGMPGGRVGMGGITCSLETGPQHRPVGVHGQTSQCWGDRFCDPRICQRLRRVGATDPMPSIYW